MITVCNGQWTERPHAPSPLEDRPPLSNPAEIEVACDRCAQAMGATIKCHGCHRVDTKDGLCDWCERMLSAQVGGEPIVEVTIYRAGFSPAIMSYDGIGAVDRIRFAQRQPFYMGFRLRRLEVVAA